MRVAAVLAFLVAVFPLVATPGASFTLLTQRVGGRGRRYALPVILGTVTGLYVHATLAAIGLSALVMRSSELFSLVRYAGAAYLIGLGILTWRRATRPATPDAPAEPEASAGGRARRLPWTGHSTYVQALLGNVLNPKAASIFLTLMPQFVDPRHPVAAQMLVLATAMALLMTVWLLTWTVIIGWGARLVRSRGVRSVMARITGAVLVALGVRTAVT